jgi:hypothetical protein
LKTNPWPKRLAGTVLCLPLVALAATASEPPPSQSCAAPIVAAIAKRAGIAPDTGVVSAACKPWPAEPQATIAAIAFDLGTADQKTLVVATLDTATQRVTRSDRQEVIEDAVTEFGEGSLGIDTAPYRLADNVRAFGVRFGSVARGASCGEGYWSDELTLFVPEAGALRSVLQGLAMQHAQALQGCFGPGNNGDLVYDDAYLTLGMANTQSHGLRDLVVTARIYRNGRETDKQKPTAVERRVLHYDGKQYRDTKMPPWWLSVFRAGE